MISIKERVQRYEKFAIYETTFNEVNYKSLFFFQKTMRAANFIKKRVFF